MSTNQYRGREETDKKDFAKMTPEEQKEYSKKHQSDQDEEPINEKIAEQEKAKYEKEQARRSH
jgi:hypothetical protein